jgi:chromosome partitioning protein
MAKIISLTQLKGGSGKSTLAINLAGYFAKRFATGLIDADIPQGTSASWASIRSPDSRLQVRTAQTHHELIERARELDATCKLIIIDTPPRTQEITRASLILSDLAIVPVGASTADIWACSDLVTVIKEAKAESNSLEARLVWTRYRAGTNTAKELSAVASKELGIPEFKTKIHNRVAYIDTIGRGLTVMEWHDKQARQELTELATEIEKRLKL